MSKVSYKPYSASLFEVCDKCFCSFQPGERAYRGVIEISEQEEEDIDHILCESCLDKTMRVDYSDEVRQVDWARYGEIKDFAQRADKEEM